MWNVTALLFWAFLGWENLSFSLGEMKDPKKNVLRLYWLNFALVATIYVLLALISSEPVLQEFPLRGLRVYTVWFFLLHEEIF